MKKNTEWSKTEKRIGETMRKIAAGTDCSAPPFEKIAGGIAAGQPTESFEEFFAGEETAVAAVKAEGGRAGRKIFAGAAAAVLIAFAAGGIAVGAVFGGAKSAAESAEECQNNYCLEADRVENHSEEANVSDSDANDCSNDHSSDADNG